MFQAVVVLKLVDQDVIVDWLVDHAVVNAVAVLKLVDQDVMVDWLVDHAVAVD